MSPVTLLTRLLFMREEMSLAKIASVSGIPYSTLNYFSRGLRSLPSHWEDSLIWQYSQEVQNRAQRYGIDMYNAITLSYLSPERVQATLGGYIEKINYLTLNSMSRKLYNEGKEISMNYIRKNFASTRERVMGAIESNKRTIAEVIDERY